MSNCSVPFDLAAMIDRFAGNPKAGREVGLHYATYQIIDLMTHGVDGIHIYTMNKPEIGHLLNVLFSNRRCASMMSLGAQ